MCSNLDRPCVNSPLALIVFKDKKVVLFGLPAAFSPTCHVQHLPGYVKHAEAFKAKGYEIACLSTNDIFALDAWGKAMKATGVVVNHSSPSSEGPGLRELVCGH